MKRLAVLAVLSAVVALTPVAEAAETNAIDVTGIVALLDVLDALMVKHADYEAESKRIGSLEEEGRRAALDAKAAENAADDEVGRLMDALYATPAYTMYFLQFRHAPPAVHRNVLLALPYEAISSPAGISHNLRELCFHRDAVRAWLSDVVSRLDLDRCRQGAAKWLPAGDYRIPPTRFIYDGNGDAFAQFGGVCFDLFSLVLRERPRDRRFDDLSGIGVDRIEAVLAHEFHHVFARPLRKSTAPPEWAAQQKLFIATRIVSEGVAMRCDVGPCIRRDAMEDTVTVAYWIGQLNDTFAAMDKGELSEDEWERWHGDTYHRLARERLREFFARTRPEDDIDSLMAEHASARPSMVYTLGWWMLSRIVEQPDGRARAFELLADPGRVFELYNEAVDVSALRITAP